MATDGLRFFQECLAGRRVANIQGDAPGAAAAVVNLADPVCDLVHAPCAQHHCRACISQHTGKVVTKAG